MELRNILLGMMIMLDGDSALTLLGIILVYAIYFIMLLAFFLVAGFIVSWLGFNGFAWWIITIVVCLFIASIYAMINRIGR
jgi:hypothetical protein